MEVKEGGGIHRITHQNLQFAFAGESQAHMKYLIFSEVAQKEERPNIARLFRAIAYAELVHPKNHLEVLKGVDNTQNNLETAIGGEKFEVEEMRSAYNEVARLQNEKEAEKSIRYALEAEKNSCPVV